MALVMLPSDLPWWDSVKKQLKKIGQTKNTLEIIQAMQKIYEMCCVSLDPDDEIVDPHQFVGFLNFLDNEMTCDERSNFLNRTLPSMVKRALMIKELRPRRGIHFSLQQQNDVNEFDYNLASSLVANAFFSTFPKRTAKTHPTLQNFNFADFFKELTSRNQQAKLRSIFHYFDWLEIDVEHSMGSLKISRQVMHSKEWLTIDDWLECCLELCPLSIKHDSKLDRASNENLQICFSSSKVGGHVLSSATNQESISFTTIPELLMLLLHVEALEDNEVLTVERVRQISRINDPKHKALLEKFDQSKVIDILCIDADDYTKLPIGQYEEDNILRELNKCLLGFQQNNLKNEPPTTSYTYCQRHNRRLSPIGESVGSNQSDGVVPLITQTSCSTTKSDSIETNNNTTTNQLQVRLGMEMAPTPPKNFDGFVNNRRGRFIVLGSSGECLPVTRFSKASSSSDDDFHSAKSSLDNDDDGSDDEHYDKRYSIDLGTAERRQTFAERLREALKNEEIAADDDDDDDSSIDNEEYAVGISVTGSGIDDDDIKLKRGGSTGFALKEDSLDEEFLQNSLTREKEWIDKFKSKTKKSSDYSFSTEYSSELEEVYEQFSQWLDNPILETEKGKKKELDTRDLAVVKFAGSLLKRTLSESFAGVPVPLTEAQTEPDRISRKNKMTLNVKSLSLELARQKHKLAAQLVSDDKMEPNVVTNKRAWFITEAIIQTLEDITFTAYLPIIKVTAITKPNANGLKSVATGNWGCGSSRKGDVQLKVIIQWMAASVAGLPSLIYYTHNHQQLVKLDTVCRILIDRKWTVKDLAEATLRYSNHVLKGRELSGTFFEELIGNNVY